MVIKSYIKPVTIFISVILLLASCGLVGDKEKQESFEPVFKAQINGETFDGTGFFSEQFQPRAGITQQGEYPYLQISATQFYEDIFPHKEKMLFSIIYMEEHKYPTQRDTLEISEDFFRFPGASYYEADGDVLITGYENFDDKKGYITVNLDTLETGEVVVSGTFETRVTTAFGASSSYSPWHGVDTLHITNGEYRVLLRDRRNE